MLYDVLTRVLCYPTGAFSARCPVGVVGRRLSPDTEGTLCRDRDQRVARARSAAGFKQSLFTVLKIWSCMDNQNHCMSIKKTRLIVNAHKHNLLINSFCNDGYVCLY